MTLIVSLSTPDGIVIAGDSLSTMMSNKLLEADFTVQCQSCQQSNTFRGRVPNVYSSNTLSHAQKILPFLDKYAIGTFGLGQILGKSIYFILRELEVSLLKKPSKSNTIDDIAQQIGGHIQMTWSRKCIHSVKLLFSFSTISTQIDLDSYNEDMNATDNYYKTS